jgi:N4-gp56 family major capsid protein
MITSALAGIVISTLGMSPELRTFYASGLLSELTPNLCYRADANVASIPAGNAPTLIHRRPRKLVVNDPQNHRLTEGIAPNSMTRNVDFVRIPVFQYGGWMGTTDFVQAIAFDKEVYQNQKALGFFSAEVMDTNLRDSFVTDVTQVIFANNRTARSAVAAGDVITDVELKKAAALLTHNNVPKFGDRRYHGIYPALASYDLMGTQGWLQPAYQQNRMDIESGDVRDLYGISPKFTSLVTRFPGAGSGGIDVFAAYIYGPEAFGTADLAAMGLQSPMVAANTPGPGDPLGQRGSQGSKWTDGVKVLDARRIVRIEFALGFAG